jgi:hypothetical protein
MFTNGALKQLIALEEKKPDHGQLITSAYDTNEFFVPAPFEWQLGSLFVGVLNTNHERVSVFMYVGAVDDNCLCVTIDHAPIPIIFNTVSLQQTICKFLKSYKSRTNIELMYVPTTLITRQGMLPVIPLRVDQVATCFYKGGSFQSVRDLFQLYDKQTAPLGKTRNCLFKDWLRAALVSGNDDNSRSQLEIAPTISAQFTLDQSNTIYSDVGEAFHQGDEDNTFGKLVAEGIRNTFSLAFNPTGPPENVGPNEDRALNPTRPPAEGDDVGPDKGRIHHPPTTITPPEGNTKRHQQQSHQVQHNTKNPKCKFWARGNGQLHLIQRWNNNTELGTVLYREGGVRLSTYKTTLEDTPEYTIVRATGPVREQLTRFKITPIATWQDNQYGTIIHLEQWDTSRPVWEHTQMCLECTGQQGISRTESKGYRLHPQPTHYN